MYHPEVIAREQKALERRTGVQLKRYTPEYCWAVEERLKVAWDAEKGLVRGLSTEESNFIRNERLLASIDFHYWTRYCWILPDASVSDGTLVRFEPWPSQQLLLDALASRENEQYQAHHRGEPQDGNLLAVPKARQEGATMLARTLITHRITTSPHTLAVSATENETKRLALYSRDQRILDNLPWWLHPSRGAPDKTGEVMTFDKLDCAVIYQDYAQEGSLAAGEQFLVGHMSEVAQGSPAYIAGMMTLQYFPAIPQSWRACHLLESTPNGRGDWWHEFIKSAQAGLERWRVKFIPWYAVPFKYRRTPPDGWQPSQVATLHAEMVERTSPEYMGKAIRLSREQLYWWESTREEYRKKGELTFFLTNYAATLEESFQFSGTSIFPYETIEHYRLMTRDPGGVYELTEH